MNFPRETIYAALFALGSGITWTDPSGANQFQLKSRRMLQWDDSTAGNQPAFLQREAREAADQQLAFGAPHWKLKAQWWIYLQIPPEGSLRSKDGWRDLGQKTFAAFREPFAPRRRDQER